MESIRQQSKEAKLLLLLLNFIAIGSEETIPECKQNFKGCCVGYFWNLAINRCKQCMPGYTGLNCSYKCPYPLYGYRCQGYCDCSNDSCDVSTGCRTITSDVPSVIQTVQSNFHRFTTWPTSRVGSGETIPECKENFKGCCVGYIWNPAINRCIRKMSY
eukprot:XP_019922751.1 PREDICTED: multiple epidermal growth factor-like domains protein 6 [Crassostrea gigas]